MTLKVLSMEPLDGIISIVLQDPAEGVSTKQRVIDVPPELMAKYHGIADLTPEERLKLLQDVVALPTVYADKTVTPAHGHHYAPDSISSAPIPDEITRRKSPFTRTGPRAR